MLILHSSVHPLKAKKINTKAFTRQSYTSLDKRARFVLAEFYACYSPSPQKQYQQICLALKTKTLNYNYFVAIMAQLQALPRDLNCPPHTKLSLTTPPKHQVPIPFPRRTLGKEGINQKKNPKKPQRVLQRVASASAEAQLPAVKPHGGSRPTAALCD